MELQPHCSRFHGGGDNLRNAVDATQARPAPTQANAKLDARNLLKPTLLPAYDAYIDGVLAAGQGAADEVLTTVMLWHFDTAKLWPRP